MKTFKKLTSIAMMSAIVAMGAVAGYAQDPCSDESKTKLYEEFQANFRGDKAARKKAIAAGEQYVAKFGECADDKTYVDYFKSTLPKMKDRIKAEEEEEAKQARYVRFDNAVKAKNFDDVYTVGKEILQFEPEQLDVMIMLGSIGYDETIDNNNFKYNADTLRFARQAIAAMESGKTSTNYGLFAWAYKTKDNAIGEMNLSIGYITAVANKNRKEALPFLFKATTSAAATSKNPVPYEQIGLYYRDELNKLIEEAQVLTKDQKDTDTEEVAKQKVEAIKAKEAMIFGMAERAMDAFSRANKLSTAKPYQDAMRRNVEQIYQLRFERTTGLDAWMNAAVAKPFPNPLTPVQPVTDAAPMGSVATTTPVAAEKPADTAKTDTAAAKPAAKAKAPAKAKRRA